MLTKKAKKMLHTLYKEYLNKIDNQIPVDKAIYLGSANNVKINILKSWSLKDVEEAMKELDTEGFLKNYYADGTVHASWLTSSAIAKMENRKKEIFLNILDFISKFFSR